MAETENIGKMAEVVSEDILSFFKWDFIKLYNLNFDCKKPEDHSTREKHTHPVDVVFHYLDPYTNKRVLLNTDLKSYQSGSITAKSVRDALKSLARTIECARLSRQWKDRYGTFDEPTEIRGLLFAYNHCGSFDNEFYKKFFFKSKDDDPRKKVINISNIGLKKDQQIHIIEPLQIVYLNTVINDIANLVLKRRFPNIDENKHWFYYPELYLHRTHFEVKSRAATIELLSSPYLIIGHDEVTDHKGDVVEKSGYVIYYNGDGYLQEEFIYLLDTLSKNQMIDKSESIRIRCTSPNKNPDISTVFKNSISAYASAWGFDEYKTQRLAEIEKGFSTVTQVKELLSEIDVGWR